MSARPSMQELVLWSSGSVVALLGLGQCDAETSSEDSASDYKYVPPKSAETEGCGSVTKRRSKPLYVSGRRSLEMWHDMPA